MKASALTAVITAATLAGLSGCSGASSGDAESTSSTPSASELSSSQTAGSTLFNSETFGGNGRTCATCHFKQGTISPDVVQNLYASNPDAPLFRGDGADSPGSNSFSRILAHATIRVVIPLPANVSIVGSTDRSVALLRGVPTTMNTPALDPVLMYDGRAPNLVAQAADAIKTHAGSTDVTSTQLQDIADFETTLFNEGRLQNYANGGKVPQLPQGTTDSEKRGRLFFVDDPPVDGTEVRARCTWCHSGPMLNEVSKGFSTFTHGHFPQGQRFFDIDVSEFNDIGNPVYTFRFTLPDGTTKDVVSPDPGRALITGNPADVNSFKIPTVWGISKTAPYFHDNSSADLAALASHYNRLFVRLPPSIGLTDQEQADIVAYMKLL